jgi:alkylation response protein AidB-like acyl-CoA dehydrogenase
MNFGLTKEEESFRQAVRDFFGRETPTHWEGLEDYDAYDEDWPLVLEFQRKLGEKGWLGISWPKEYGGGGRSWIHNFIFDEEINYYRAPGKDLIGIGIVGPTILGSGTEEQKRRYLIPITQGKENCAPAFTEPSAGSDSAGIQTAAVDHGDFFIVNGYKHFCANGHRCEWGLFTVITDPSLPRYKNMSCLIIDMKSPGMKVVVRQDMMGHPNCIGVYLENVKVPKENLVGEKNGGWRVLMGNFNGERWIGMGYGGRARRVLDDLVDYVRGVRYGGVTLAENQAIRQVLAEVAIEVEINRLLAYKIASMRDQGILAVAESSMLKNTGADVIQKATKVGLEILGLYGQLDRHSKWAPMMAKIQRTQLWASQRNLVAGSSEVERHIIATQYLKLPRSF